MRKCFSLFLARKATNNFTPVQSFPGRSTYMLFSMYSTQYYVSVAFRFADKCYRLKEYVADISSSLSIDTGTPICLAANQTPGPTADHAPNCLMSLPSSPSASFPLAGEPVLQSGVRPVSNPGPSLSQCSAAGADRSFDRQSPVANKKPGLLSFMYKKHRR